MTGDPGRRLPAAVAVLAIAAMAVAARRDGPLDSVSTGLWDGARPLIALAAVVLLVVIATNFAKHRDDGYGLLHRAGTATALLLTAAAVLTPIGLLLFGHKPAPPAPQPEASNGPVTPKHRFRSGEMLHPGDPGGGKPYASWLALTLLYLILAAALALLVYVLAKLLSRRWSRPPITRLEFDPLPPELDQLAEAVAAGAEALEYEGDAREAVIACYSAMELAVTAGGGSSRRATDTPEEFLGRVTATKLIPDDPARRLTDLFREARFSSHRIGEEKRDAAREALHEISEHLRSRAEQLAAAAGPAQAAAAGSRSGGRI